MVFLCLLHSIIMKAANADAVYSNSGFEQTKCSISQAHCCTYDIFDNYHLHSSAMPCEMGHVDISNVPAAKSCYRFAARLRDHKSSSRAANYDSPQFSLYSLSDPVSYYVFGLRKIIV